MKKRILALLLCICLVGSLTVYAVGEDSCTECGQTEGHAETCSQYVAEDSELTLYEQLMAAETVDAMLAVAEAADPDALSALSAEEIDALFARIDALDPDGISPATEALVDLLIALPNFVSGADRDGETSAEYTTGNSLAEAGIFYANTTTAGYFDSNSAHHATCAYDSSSDAIVFNSTGTDPSYYFYVPDDSPVYNNTYATYRYITVTFKCASSSTMQLFLTTANHAAAAAGISVAKGFTGSNEYQTLIFDTSKMDGSGKTTPTGNIRGFRFDFTTLASTTMHVDTIAFCKTLSDAEYIAWERDIVRNNEGKFPASEEMLNLVTTTHNCTVEYVDLQEGDQTIGTFKITMIKTNCSCHVNETDQWHVKGTVDAFDPQFQLKIPGSISKDYDYLVLNFMAPSLDVIGKCGDPTKHGGVVDDHYDIPADTIPVKIGTFYAVNGGYTAKYERNTTIHAPGVFYSEIINIDDDLQNDAATIRFDPFNSHFAKAGSVLYLQAVMFCKTEEEAKEVAEEQLGSIYPYGYNLIFNANADGVSGIPSGESIMRSAYATHKFTVSYDLPTKDNYKFLGWSLNSDGSGALYQSGTSLEIAGTYGKTVTTTLYAIWEEGTGRIQYSSDVPNANLTTGETLPHSTTYSSAQSFVLPEAEADGYTFQNWELYHFSEEHSWSQATYTAGTVMPVGTHGDVVLKAQFTPNNYTLTYNTDGGQPIAARTFTVEDTWKLPAPTKPGYTFSGWKVTSAEGSWVINQVYAAGDQISSKYGNATLTAQWAENEVTFTYTAESDGSVTLTSETVRAATGSPHGSTAEPNPGYDFLGWYVGDTCITSDATLMPQKNSDGIYESTAYTAKFKPAYSSLTISLAFADGTAPAADEVFIFNITGDPIDSELDPVDIQVTLTGAKRSVTLNMLPVGEYQVKELTGWSWRYVISDVTGETSVNNEKVATIEVNRADVGYTLTFTNQINEENIYWLTGEALKKYTFK